MGYDNETGYASNPKQMPVEEAPFWQNRVDVFCSLYESCSPEEATEYFDDIKLRDFFGCESADFQTDGLRNYREALLNASPPFREWSCPWLYGKMCFPVKERFADAKEVK